MTTTKLATTEPVAGGEASILSGGERLSVFDIMQRYRTDGSCEHIIKDALNAYAHNQQTIAALEKTIRHVGLSLHALSGPDSGLLGATLRELRDELHAALAQLGEKK